MEMQKSGVPQEFEGVDRGLTPQQAAFRERTLREQEGASALRRELLDFIEQELPLVKRLSGQGKKDLAREVVHLRGVVKTIKRSIDGLAPGQPAFGHAEAFRLMSYVQTHVPEGEEPDRMLVWNSRDGVTPAVVHVGARRYEHLGPVGGLHYDLPTGATHKWVTRTEAETLTAWRRTLDKAVAMGKLDPDKAALQRDNLEAAESWNYRIGLVVLSSGRFTDEELLAPTEDELRGMLREAGLTIKKSAECAAQVLARFGGKPSEKAHG
jgi:hypothetical protein